LLVQPQLCALHVWVAVLQHWPPTQSLFEQQAAHLPSQHTCPPTHWALLVQPQLCALQVCVALSQHWPPTQSLFEQH
jgi:hypothetical protein